MDQALQCLVAAELQVRNIGAIDGRSPGAAWML